MQFLGGENPPLWTAFVIRRGLGKATPVTLVVLGSAPRFKLKKCWVNNQLFKAEWYWMTIKRAIYSARIIKCFAKTYQNVRNINGVLLQ